MSNTPILRPLNDLNVALGPFETVSSAGVKTPIGTGTISGFLAVTGNPDAVSAHANFSVANLTYV